MTDMIIYLFQLQFYITLANMTQLEFKKNMKFKCIVIFLSSYNIILEKGKVKERSELKNTLSITIAALPA